MFANTKALAVVLSCALIAHAQTPTSTAPASQSSLPAGVDQCILACAQTAAQANNCGSTQNTACFCTDPTVQANVSGCITENCPASDQQVAATLQQEICGNSSSSSTAASNSATGTSASASAVRSATGSSAAMAFSAPLSLGSIVGTLVASAGVLVGAAFVL